MLVLLAGCSLSMAAVKPLEMPGMGVRVEAGTYTVRGMKVNRTFELPVAPPERITVTREEQVLVDERPAAYTTGTALSKTFGPVDKFTRYPKAIDPASVRVYSCDTGQAYREGTDYILDHDWGGVARIETGSVPKDTRLCFDYQVLMQRIDILQASRDGRVSVKQGRSVVANPEIPEPDRGCVALANVWVSFRTTEIGAGNVFALPADDTTWRSFITSSGRENLSTTLGLLKSKKPVTVMCWGDSVTQGGSPSSHDRCYVELLRSRLKEAYRDAPITLVNAGIGGSNTESRRAGFDAEVLAHNPDLVTMEYINDVGLGPEKIKANYAEFIGKARQRNPKVEFIIITPHQVMPEWMGSFGASVEAMRVAARENRAALADTAIIWANLSKVGIPYETLLANGINHPNDLGHEFFAATLMELLHPQAMIR